MKECVFPEYIKDGKPQGDLIRHLRGVIREWDSIKECYLNAIYRVLRRISDKLEKEEVDKLIRVMLLLHDYGKLAKAYLNVRGYLHEILGAYLALKIKTEERIKRLISAAIFLHHEHRIYKFLKRGGLPIISVSVLSQILGKFPNEIEMLEYANECFIKLLREEGVENYLSEDYLCDSYRKEDIYSLIAKELSRLSQKSGYKLFFGLGILNHILILTDIRDAYKNREEHRRELSLYFELVIKGGRLCRSY